MKECMFKNYDELPLFLYAETVAELLGISISSIYGLMHEKGFPSLHIGSRLIVPKEKFRACVGERAGKWGYSVKYTCYPTRDAVKNYFPLPNEILGLNLCYGEIAVYAYLMYCEDRKTF